MSPGQEGASCPDFARRKVITKKPGGRPRKGGLGAMTVSARRGSALTGSGPQGIFGSFLGKQKGTRPAGRNPASRIEIYDLKENNHG